MNAVLGTNLARISRHGGLLKLVREGHGPIRLTASSIVKHGFNTLSSSQSSSSANERVLDSLILTNKTNTEIRNKLDLVAVQENETLKKDNNEIITGGESCVAVKLPFHYIDTLAVFHELTKAGFTQAQAKKIIALTEDNLNRNLDRVVRKYVPKMDLENENYLFEAASSELLVEIIRSREQHLNELRSGVNMLDREMNSVTDELNDLMITCKNDSEVAMNDHRSDNTLLQKELNIKIREVENRINSQLISEMKFSVESLRWSLTRRGILCIMSVAASVLLAVTTSKVFNSGAGEPEITNTPTKDDFIKDNDEFPKDNDEYVQYEEWHEPKKIGSS